MLKAGFGCYFALSQVTTMSPAPASSVPGFTVFVGFTLVLALVPWPRDR
jgi:hypothetical protein